MASYYDLANFGQFFIVIFTNFVQIMHLLQIHRKTIVLRFFNSQSIIKIGNLLNSVNPNHGGLFRVSFCGECVGGGRGLKLRLSKTRYNYARSLKFGTQLHTHM